MKDVIILGGDNRLKELYGILKDYFCVDISGFDMLENTDTININDAMEHLAEYSMVVLPIPLSVNGKIKMPFSKTSVSEDRLLKKLKKGQKVLYGGIKDVESSAEMINILKNKRYARQNAYYTAVITLELLKTKYMVELYGSNVLVTGFGKIASSMCDILKSRGVSVSAAARSEAAKTEIIKKGYEFINIYSLAPMIGKFDVIINTVPAVVIKENELRAAKPGVLIVDVASPPYGVDFKAAECMGVMACIEQGLPGKYMPAEEAMEIARIIFGELGGD